MIVAKDWKRELGGAFKQCGFEWLSSQWRAQNEVLLVAVNPQRSDFEDYWYLNVGFLLLELEPFAPSRLEKMHAVYRLERLFPNEFEQIRNGCALDSSTQPEATRILCASIVTIFVPGFHHIMGNCLASRSSILRNLPADFGWITPEARAFLRASEN